MQYYSKEFYGIRSAYLKIFLYDFKAITQYKASYDDACL